MKGVIYARYSSDNQREESIEGQLRECKVFAEKNGITILGDYIDRAMSAKTDNRPQFQKMMKDSAKGMFDVVIVWKLDRFARNRYDSAHHKNTLKKNGVKLVSATEPISDDPSGILLESMLEGYAEYFSAELAEKVMRGMTENALKCQYNGGGITLGYTVDEEKHFQIDPIVGPAIQDAFKMYDKGALVKEVTDELNRRGVRSQHGHPVSINNVTRLLKNRRYIGEYRYHDIVTPGGMPTLISADLFERVQQRMVKNYKAPARKKAEDEYLLTTKLFCGKCGSFMVGESGTSRTGETHRYYKCVSAKKKTGCNKKSVKKDWIEDIVIRQIRNIIFDDKLIEHLTDMVLAVQSKENTTIPILREKLAEAEKGIENVLNAIQAGIFTPSTKGRLDALEKTKADLELAIMKEEMTQPTLSRDFIKFFFHRYRQMDMTSRADRQRLVDSFVNAIYLYDDKIVLTFNYKEGSKTITLSDISGSDMEAGGEPVNPVKS